ncbi:Rv1733c family protein [Nocardia australiensis]|uniref:Rv1733c family protein n=1 Tax=Nocardia australiensis TaxID=2887191 RepID=UPI001D14FD40|nr:hypothetical protein [Nocardia australiensis]
MDSNGLVPWQSRIMYTWRRNPLMRTSYRVQSVLHGIVVAAIVLAIPVAVTLGMVTHDRLVERSEQLRSVLHTVDATLDADAEPVATAPMDAPSTAVSVQGHWVFSGTSHNGQITTKPSARQGDRILVWVSADGNQVPPPPSASGALRDSIAVAVAAFVGMSTLLLLSGGGIDWLLDRVRRETWGREWTTLAADRRWNAH